MKPVVKYCGVHQEAAAYNAGNLVTRNGGLWFCADATTTSTPGDDSSWRLIVRRGAA
jgi:hypothetical protein